MDLRYERLRYFLKVGRKTHRGVAYYEPWHPHGSFEQPREDRYKKIDRATIGASSAARHGSVRGNGRTDRRGGA